ncbi:N-6 DNA methylase [Limosilactobacillus reuteri]|uniref:site-specific DNA-methyltransferase (adenine-specific) n=2 Tax=Limosilactobacillus reuteri TaxID=1598 RepID=A0ABD6Y8D0_LIMRT|nr:class I SAM-dependent DNA methyltransferase [Limosilactobacillus reuteri]MRH46199.1 N-6 DNA methylase [Limosilactobacillus reuteri]PWT38038.1 N-6 DNA methylase [Limosilactobacillus reuteri]PWT42284.1 N-6 DNA methylase [Limosilactobacillus reuteri]QWS03688.1 SAM-dependent DNA methyltransferase [Limosilactobacillus reuteri]
MVKIDTSWDEQPVDITSEANFIWSIANKLRGTYMPDKYGDVIIPMTIIRRFECALEPTKDKVLAQYEAMPTYPARAMYKISGFQFYNTSKFDLQELCNDPDNINSNFKSYLAGFSADVQEILRNLDIESNINKMDKGGCLYSVVKAFSELDLSVAKFDSIKMGYIFENLIARFYQNVDAGQFYTGRDIIRLCVSLLLAEGSEDILEDNKVVTVLDQACGTGGMLSTAYTYLKHLNPTADVHLFGQELMGQSYAVGLAEMLIKDQNIDNFKHADTLKEDCFPNQKMRFVLENPPFGTPWGGKDAKQGQEESVKEEYLKGDSSRWPAGLPKSSDAQLLFLQSALNKLDNNGRAAIIENGSPLFTGDTASGESQIRRWLLENDYLDAIIAMPTDLFYNTPIATYIWILSKNKVNKRKNKIQFIDATNIFEKLRKPLGKKRNEFSKENRAQIVKLYTDFQENKLSQIHDNSEFIYREYTVMQPLQRCYAITEQRIQNMVPNLRNFFDPVKYTELKDNARNLSARDTKKLIKFKNNKPIYDQLISILKNNVSDKVYKSPETFIPVIKDLMSDIVDNRLLKKIVEGLSQMDKSAEVQTDKKGNIIYDRDTADSEIVNINTSIDKHMEKYVLPFIPDAKAFFEEDLGKKRPVIKTGAEIPFTRYFYEYQKLEKSNVLGDKIRNLENKINAEMQELFR